LYVGFEDVTKMVQQIIVTYILHSFSLRW